MMALGLYSCGNENEPELKELSTQTDDVKVAKISDFISTVSRTSDSDETVLQFKSQEVYDSIIAKLKSMSDSERKAYFDNLGFKGAYTTLQDADEELDKIFDSEEDSLTICRRIENYLLKHQDTLAFNEEDPTDVTPNLTFEDEDAAIVGSVNGYVVIGNEVKLPEESKVSIPEVSAKKTKANPQPVYSGKFIKFDRCTLEIKNKKYRSTISMGRMGSFMAFRTETFKKILFFKKKDNNVGHNCVVILTRGNNKAVINVRTKNGNFRTGISAYDYSPVFNVTMQNFWSTRGSAMDSKTFYNVIVKG